MRPVHERAETVLVKLVIIIKAPVIRDKCDVVWAGNLIRLANDQWPVQPPRQLFPPLVMRVVPEASGILQRKPVGETLTRLDGGLCQIGNTVHLVQVPDPVPVHRRRHIEIVQELHLEFLTAPCLDQRPRRGAAIEPQAGCRPVRRTKMRRRRRGGDGIAPDPGRQRRQRQHRDHGRHRARMDTGPDEISSFHSIPLIGRVSEVVRRLLITRTAIATRISRSIVRRSRSAADRSPA